jgi:hypothetical protein
MLLLVKCYLALYLQASTGRCDKGFQRALPLAREQVSSVHGTCNLATASQTLPA